MSGDDFMVILALVLFLVAMPAWLVYCSIQERKDAARSNRANQ